MDPRKNVVFKVVVSMAAACVVRRRDAPHIQITDEQERVDKELSNDSIA